MLAQLKAIFFPDKRVSPTTSNDGDHLSPSEELKFYKGLCPDCSNRESMLEGPSGGGSINVLCKNCHSEFCVGIGVMRISDKGRGRYAMYGLPLKVSTVEDVKTELAK